MSSIHVPSGESSPIFVVGCGHSGTSLLLALLGEHPHIFAIPGETRAALKGDSQILEWQPRAKVLLIGRDGRDVAYSLKQRTGDLKEGIIRWVNDNTAGLPYWNHTSVFVVKYESLITNFEQTLTDLFDFLGETYLPSIKEFHKTPKKWYAQDIIKPENAFKENHGAFRNWQINQPLFDGRGRWKSLSEHELELIYAEAGSLLEQLDYR